MENTDNYNLGVYYFDKKEYTKSLEELLKVYKNYNSNYQLLVKIGVVYYKMKEYRKSEEFLLKALLNTSEETKAKKALEILYRGEDSIDKSELYYETMKKKGDSYLNEGCAIEKAIQYYKEALIGKDDYTLALRLGDYYFEKWNYEENPCFYYYRKAFKINPCTEVIKHITDKYTNLVNYNYLYIDDKFTILLLEMLEHKPKEQYITDALKGFYKVQLFCECCGKEITDLEYHNSNSLAILEYSQRTFIKKKELEEEAKRCREIIDEYKQLKQEAETFAKSEVYKPGGVIAKMIEKEFNEHMKEKQNKLI